jgi:hypothetical protein
VIRAARLKPDHCSANNRTSAAAPPRLDTGQGGERTTEENRHPSHHTTGQTKKQNLNGGTLKTLDDRRSELRIVVCGVYLSNFFLFDHRLCVSTLTVVLS